MAPPVADSTTTANQTWTIDGVALTGDRESLSYQCDRILVNGREKMRRNLMTSLIIAALLASQVDSAYAHSQDLQSRLDVIVKDYSLAAPSFLHALHKLATDFKLPMGVEWVREYDSLRPVRLSWSAASLSQIIARVVAEYPHYRMSADGSIVHVFHAGFRNVLTDALSLRVGPIDIKDEALAVASGFRVRPRVRRALQPALSVGGGEGGSIASGPGGDRRVTIKSANPTLREVLDMLAGSAGEVIWVVTYPPHGLSEGRWQLTVTMGGHPVSPQHQPHWEFLPWGPPSLVKANPGLPLPQR